MTPNPEPETWLRRWQEAILFVLPWYVACVWYKRQVGSGSIEGNLVLARNALPGVGAWWRSGVFALDTLLLLVLMPGLLALFTAWLTPRARRLSLLLVLQPLLMATTGSWIVWTIIGRFPTVALVRDFLDAYKNDPGLVAPDLYLSRPMGVVALGFILAGFLPLFVLAVPFTRVAWSKWLRPPMTLAVILLCLLAVAGLAREDGYHALHRPLAVQMAREFFQASHLPDRAASRISDPEAILADYRAIAWGPGAPDHRRYTTPHRDAPPARNLALVILETHAAADYDFTDPRQWPSLARLLPRAIVARNHYASSPVSARSDFSVFTSLYDLPGATSLARELEGTGMPGIDALPRILASRGYETRYYYGGRQMTFSEEGWLVAAMGFQQVSMSTATGPLRLSATERISADSAAYHQAEQFIGARPAGAPPFLVVIRTMLGHEPMLNPLAPDSFARTPDERRSARMHTARAEDAMVARLLEVLERQGQLERTVIILLGDHGVRIRDGTRLRDKRLIPGRLNEVMFRVPLLVFDAERIGGFTEVTDQTSHIDVMPTALDLLGIDGSRLFHMGTSLLAGPFAGRTLFLLGEGYLGADAALRDSVSYMRNYLTGAELEGAHLDFANQEATGSLSPAGDSLRTRLQQQRDLLIRLRHTLVTLGRQDGSRE